MTNSDSGLFGVGGFFGDAVTNIYVRESKSNTNASHMISFSMTLNLRLNTLGHRTLRHVSTSIKEALATRNMTPHDPCWPPEGTAVMSVPLDF